MSQPEPRYDEGDTVYTIEGLAGEVAGPPEWNGDDWEYPVEWEDGKHDTQPELFFRDETLGL
jgi:hypothetical protein